MIVFKKYSELTPGAQPLDKLYWDSLQIVPQNGAVGVASAINNTLAIAAREREAHNLLHERFLRPVLQKAFREQTIAPPAFPVVFSHFGCLVVLRDLILFGREVPEPELQTFGDLALLANDFLLGDFAPTDDLDITVSFARTWDLNNQRDLAYSLSRMQTILTSVLASDDRTVSQKRAELGIDPNTLQIDGLKLMDFVSVVFGLYALACKRLESRGQPVIFDYKKVLSQVNLPQELLDAFIARRSLTLADFKARLTMNGRTGSVEDFRKQLAEKDFLTTDLNLFRSFPLVRLEDNFIALLDLQFLVELLSFGVYWSIFDALEPQKRDVFKQLWGRLFEIYAVDLLGEVYSPSARILYADIEFEGGQIDAMLDCTSEVILFEIKSSLLTEAAKRSGDRRVFEADVRRKFVVNERGRPKAVRQLAISSKAIVEGKIATKDTVKRIYPVLITDEPAVAAFGFNTYLDGLFRQEVGAHETIKNLTVMTIDELEEFLAYAVGGKIGWSELLEFRLKKGPPSVSVSQDVYDFRLSRGNKVRRNTKVLQRFEAVTRLIDKTYRGQ